MFLTINYLYKKQTLKERLTRAVCGEACTAGSGLLRRHLEAGGEAEGEEEEEQSGGAQHLLPRH